MNRKHLIVMGLALGLPSTILGVFGFIYLLVQKGYINWTVALVLLLLVIFNMFYLIFRYARKSKNQSE